MVEGELTVGEQIDIHIDQAITQDATGTTAFLLYESMQRRMQGFFVRHLLSLEPPDRNAPDRN